MEFSSLGDGHRLVFCRPGNEPQEISLRKWSSACISAISSFVDSVNGLVFNSKILDHFRPQDMTDEKNLNAAPHRQAQNQVLINPYQEHLEKEIFATLSTGSQQVDPVKAETWLAAEQATLTMLADILCLAGGISFRGWQLSSIRYDSSDSQARNIWIIDKTIVVSHPKAKQRNLEYAPTLLAFPRSMTTHLIIYLYHIRPIACSILKVLKRENAVHSTFLWVNSMPTKGSDLPSLWDGARVSACLQEFTDENMTTPLSPLLVRQVSQAVMRDKFPQLFSTIMSKNVSLAEYGRLCEFPPWQDLKPDRAVFLLAVSQIWQAMLGLSPVMQVWLPLVESSHIFPSEWSDNYEMAFLSAKQLLAGLEEGLFSQDYSKVSLRSSYRFQFKAQILHAI